VVPAGSVKSAMNKGTGDLGFYVEEERQQRAGLFLRNVAYVIHADFEMTEKAGSEDNVVKFEQMFIRRASIGQCFHRPYFGCREFPVDFEFIAKDAGPIVPLQESRDLGWMLFDMDRTGDEAMPQFFHASMTNGVIDLRNVEVRS